MILRDPCAIFLALALAAPAMPAAPAIASAASAATQPSTQPSPDPRFRIGHLLHADDFATLSHQWIIELENGGTVAARNGTLDINVPAGATVWYKPLLHSPVLIQYQATAISAGGPNDRVSDLNCFWMASDTRNPADFFAVHRTGKFADYNRLLTYYVGLGGNSNTTTRFRRYIGSDTLRPLLPQNDRRDSADLLVPNRPQPIQLVADGSLIQFYRDGQKLFELNDPHPYTAGHFGFRTTQSHLHLAYFRVYRLLPPPH